MAFYRGKTEAISPVLSAILLIAITVVLAALLFIMVMGFGGNTQHTPVGMWSKAEVKDSRTEILTLTTLDPMTKWSECKIIIENLTSGSTDTPSLYTMSHNAGVVDCTRVSGTVNLTLEGTDINKDNQMGQGDYITVTGVFQSKSLSYRVILLYIATGSQIDDIVFYR